MRCAGESQCPDAIRPPCREGGTITTVRPEGRQPGLILRFNLPDTFLAALKRAWNEVAGRSVPASVLSLAPPVNVSLAEKGFWASITGIATVEADVDRKKRY